MLDEESCGMRNGGCGIVRDAECGMVLTYRPAVAGLAGVVLTGEA